VSATKEFLYELEEFVWLIEFAGLSFEQRGKAIELCNEWYDKYSSYEEREADIYHEWFDTAYSLIEEDGGENWATGKQAERLLSLVS
jgi:hypothetical protein